MPAELPSYFFPLLWAGLVMLTIGVLGIAVPRSKDAAGQRRWRIALMSLGAAACVGTALGLALVFNVG